MNKKSTKNVYKHKTCIYKYDIYIIYFQYIKKYFQITCIYTFFVVSLQRY